MFYFDINPYALSIAKSKTQHPLNHDSLLKIINRVKIDTSSIDLSKIPSWVLEYYNLDTLKEILFLLTPSLSKIGKNVPTPGKPASASHTFAPSIFNFNSLAT